MAENTNAILNIRKKALNILNTFGKKTKDEHGEILAYQDPLMMIAYVGNDLVAVNRAVVNSDEYETVYVWSDAADQLMTFILDESWVGYLELLDAAALVKNARKDASS